MNTTRETYWSNPDHFIDWMNRSSDIVIESGEVTERRDGWIARMSPNARCLYHIIFGDAHTHVPAGNYVIYGGGRATKLIRSAGLLNVSAPSEGRVTFTVPPGAGNGTWLQLVLENRTGAELGPVADIHICRVGDESKIEAGVVYNEAYHELQRYYRTAGSRCMTSTPAAWPETIHPKTPADLAHYTGKRRSFDANGAYVPFDVLARFSSDLKQNFWFCFPFIRDGSVFSLDAKSDRVLLFNKDGSPYNHGWAEGTGFYLAFDRREHGIPNHVVLYARNPAGNSCQISLTPRGRIIDITRDRARSWEWASRWYSEEDHLRLWRAIVSTQIRPAYRHNGEIWFEVGNEPWNTQFNNVHYLQHYGVAYGKADRRDDIPHYQERIGFGLARLSLLAMKVMREFYPAERLRLQMNSQIAWFDHFNRMWDYVDDGLVAPGVALKDMPRVDASVATYIAPTNPATGKVFETFQELVRAGFARWTDEQIKQSYLGNLPELKGWLDTTKAGLARKNPDIRLTCYETGSHLWLDAGPANGTPEYKACSDRAFAFYQSRAMAEVIKAQVDTLHVQGGVVNYAQFVDLGFSRSRFIGGWGVTEHIASPKNPRAAYLASLGAV